MSVELSVSELDKSQGEQEVVEEVRQVGGMGKCEAEERNCCRCECCW